MSDAAPTKEISIHDQVFTVSAPYTEGHVLLANEAKALNQVRAENIANNFRKRIKAALDGVPLKEGDPAPTLEGLTAEMLEYDVKYNFSVPSTGREPVDPLERICLRLAKENLRAALASAGRKMKDIDEDKLDHAIATLAEREDIVTEAKRQLKASKKAVESSLTDLGI